MYLKLMTVVGVLVALVVNYCNSDAFLYGSSFIESLAMQSFKSPCNGKKGNDEYMKSWKRTVGWLNAECSKPMRDEWRCKEDTSLCEVCYGSSVNYVVKLGNALRL